VLVPTLPMLTDQAPMTASEARSWSFAAIERTLERCYVEIFCNANHNDFVYDLP
jgi:hypothetical protein